MALIVVDASILIDLLLHNDATFESITRELHRKRMAAPHLIDAEAGQAVRRLLQLKTITEPEAFQCLTLLCIMRLRRFPHTFLVADSFRRRNNMTFYDALYLSLAEKLRCPLLTKDNVFSSIQTEVKIVKI